MGVDAAAIGSHDEGVEGEKRPPPHGRSIRAARRKPYKIYLGRVYWTAPATGTDSQAGTLIHEMSHFTVVAGTDDLAYGQTAAKSLAISNPDNAIRNADSHEYFAENTPSQN